MPNSTPGTRTPLLSDRLMNNVACPCGLAMVSYAVFLFACLIPPSVYTHYMMEPDLMFLDPASILFYSLCVASFAAGAWLVSWLLPFSFVVRKFAIRSSPTIFLMVPLTVGIVVTTASAFLFIVHNPGTLIFLVTQQGAELKEAVALETSFNLPPLLLTGIIWWAFWRSFDFPLDGWRNRVVKSTLVVAVLSMTIASLCILSRDIVIMASCGLAVSYVARRGLRREVNFWLLFRTAATIVMCGAFLFLMFSYLRGIDSWDDQVKTLIGYTVASYNRLAAIVNGDLRYPFAGRGVYLSSFVAFNHTLNRFVPLGALMNWPDQLAVWGSEFGAVSRAGLDGNLIWSGAFGYIFSDLGWFSLPFVFGYGVLYGVAWNWIKRGKVLGVVLYPCLGYCALLWWGANGLLDSQRAVIFASAVILAGYEWVFAKPKGNASAKP